MKSISCLENSNKLYIPSMIRTGICLSILYINKTRILKSSWVIKWCYYQGEWKYVNKSPTRKKYSKTFLLQTFLDFSFFPRMRILPSLKLITLDISELYNHMNEIEVFSLRGELEGVKKASAVWLRGRETSGIICLQTFKIYLKNTYFKLSHEA